MDEIISTAPRAPGQQSFRLMDDMPTQSARRKVALRSADRIAAIRADDPKIDRVRATDTENRRIARIKNMENIEIARQEMQVRLGLEAAKK